MRTTLDLDEDVLAVSRELAAQRRMTIGAVVSGLARDGLRRETPTLHRNGIRVLPRRGLATPITMGLVNRLRDELP